MRLTDAEITNRYMGKTLYSGHPELDLLHTIEALKSEHAAQLQAACVGLREKIAEDLFNRGMQLKGEGADYAFEDGPAAKKMIDKGILLHEISNEIRAAPIPTAALETAIAEARLSERLHLRFKDLATEMDKHSNDHIHDPDPSDRLGAAVEGVCADRIKAILSQELAALDAAKAKKSKCQQ